MTPAPHPTHPPPLPKHWILRFVLVGVLFDLVISVIVGWGVIRANDAASSAHIARVAAHTSCIAGNTFRQADLARWDHVLTLINTMPKNTAQQKFIAGVDAANRTADQLRDCSKGT